MALARGAGLFVVVVADVHRLAARLSDSPPVVIHRPAPCPGVSVAASRGRTSRAHVAALVVDVRLRRLRRGPPRSRVRAPRRRPRASSRRARVVAPVAATSDADRAPSSPRAATPSPAARRVRRRVAPEPRPGAAFADSLPEEEPTRLLCDASCEAALADVELVTTKSGLQYKDIVVGDGVQPEVGFQCVVDYIAKNEKGQIFDNSLEKGKPNDIRVTGDPESANVIPGLDEGLLTMRSGGIRRLYIPGELAFPKGLASAPGRPRIAPYSPVVFDVKLIYIPGME